MLSQTNPLFVPRLYSAQTQAALSCSPGSRAFYSQTQELLRLWFQCDWHWWALRVGQLIPTKGQHANYSEKMLCKGAMHVKDNFSLERLFPSFKTQKSFYSAFHIASYTQYAEVHFQSSYSFKFFQFHDFPWPFQVFHDLRFYSCYFREFSKSSVF